MQHSGKHWSPQPRHCVTMITLRSPGPRGLSVASRRLVNIYLLCYKGTNYLIHRVYHKYYPTAIKCTAIVPLFALSILQHHLKPLVGEQLGGKKAGRVSLSSIKHHSGTLRISFLPICSRKARGKGKMYNGKDGPPVKTKMDPIACRIQSFEDSQ